MRYLTDGAGRVALALDYDAYGNAVVAAADTGDAALGGALDGALDAALLAQPFRYTAREWDAGARLHHYRARTYDATTGRFLQEDPLGFFGDGLNVYGYVNANPLRFIDPYGLSSVERSGFSLSYWHPFSIRCWKCRRKTKLSSVEYGDGD